MPILQLSLSPEGVAQVHDTLLCLAKFSETASIEARREKFIISALNSTKSAYASFGFDVKQFFTAYQFDDSLQQHGPEGDDPPSFTCRIYNKALLSVFRARMNDTRDKDSAIETCDLWIQDESSEAECRLVVKFVCRHGVVKTYRLTYESVEVLHALFDHETARNRWAIQSGFLREVIEYFGTRTEHLDLYSEDGKVMFTSYTEKIMDGAAVLKQPLQTSVAIDVLEFERFSVEQKLHIGISVKDFKAVVMHADSLRATVSATFSRPSRPLRIDYEVNGMVCEFTMMTIGDYRGSSITPAPAAAPIDVNRPRQPVMRPDISQTGLHSSNRSRNILGHRESVHSPPQSRPSLDRDTLFLPEYDDSHQFNQTRLFEDDGDEDVLGWDASAVHDPLSENRSIRNTGHFAEDRAPMATAVERNHAPIAPTQRLSEVRGIFDDNA